MPAIRYLKVILIDVKIAKEKEVEKNQLTWIGFPFALILMCGRIGIIMGIIGGLVGLCGAWVFLKVNGR